MTAVRVPKLDPSGVRKVGERIDGGNWSILRL
jgi:hypothetical protein